MRIGGNLVTGIKPIQVGNMTMVIIRIIHIRQPLLQLVMLAYLHRRQTLNHALQTIPIGGISGIQQLGSRQYGSQCIQHNLGVHRTSGSNHCTGSRRALFRRHRRCTDHPAIFRMFHQEIQEEIGCPLQSRICCFQECLIACIKIMLPQMLAQPSTTQRPAIRRTIHRSGHTPQIRVMMYGPSTAFVQGACCALCRL